MGTGFWADPERWPKHGSLAGALACASGVALGQPTLASIGAAVAGAAILTYALRSDVWAF